MSHPDLDSRALDPQIGGTVCGIRNERGYAPDATKTKALP
jgi:hypothetical protein